ncbi:MAG: hypothetical protein KGS61_16595 [Verrucomicrobia bacterium]|nr:hypothetical protein [Verrucomicrobiota bacterium]
MQEPNFDEGLDQVVQRDARYHRDAYLFVREALDHTQKNLSRSSRKLVPHHVTGQELLEGIREFGLAQFGPMALSVFEEWGVRRCEDFGEIVFNMVEAKLLHKTDTDSRDDFKGGYDFREAFQRPFLPTRKCAPAAPRPRPAAGSKSN